MPSIEIDLSAILDFILRIGQLPPDQFFGLILKYIGTPIFIIVILYGLHEIYIYNMLVRFARKQKKVLLAIDIPKDNEQTPKAVENILSHLAGGHSPTWWWDVYKEGEFQQSFSLEVVSLEGYIQFLMHVPVKSRDLVEAAIFAQYPQARITEVADYTTGLPVTYPDDEYDLFGTEMVYVKNNAYPIKLYHTFGDPLNQEYKDPIAALLETFSRMGRGENAFMQIIITPIYQKWTKIGAEEINKLLGKNVGPKKNIIDKASDVPINLIKGVGDAVFGPGEGGADEKKSEGKKIMDLPPGEVNVLKLIDEKCSKLGFATKIRYVYVAKHEVFSKARAAQGFVGAIKQFNTEDGNSLKPDYKVIGTSGDYFFKWRKNKELNGRKTDIMMGYRGRIPGVGTKPIIMNIEEIASLWHFPMFSVKTPLVQKIEMKTAEPPSNLPGSSGDVLPDTGSFDDSSSGGSEGAENVVMTEIDLDNDYFEKKFAVADTKTVHEMAPPKPPAPSAEQQESQPNITQPAQKKYTSIDPDERPISPFSDNDFVGNVSAQSSSNDGAIKNLASQDIAKNIDDNAPRSAEPPNNLPT